MSLPDFETLKAMAERNEGELEVLLQAEIDLILQETPPERRRKLLGLQFQINCQKELSHNPIDCCVRLSNMLSLYYRQMRWALEEFQVNGTASPCFEANKKAGGVVLISLPSSLNDEAKS
jgi:hypothetical protein